MTSEGGNFGHKSPRGGRTTSSPGSDDEISVIAVIKKGTSGIPKRARYHYIRELPLTSVKSLKKSLQKSKETRRIEARDFIPAEGSSKTTSTKEALCVINDVKKPRVIELGDEASKMELRKQFKMVEDNTDEDEQTFPEGFSDSLPKTETANILHKLPPGTVLIKQEPSTPKIDLEEHTPSLSVNPGINNVDGSSAEVTTTTTSTSSSNSSGSSSASSISSCGSGSSSGGFGSGSVSPSGKVKRLHRTSKEGSRTKILDIVPRRNPKRCGSKKVVTISEAVVPTTTTTTMTTRPRQRRLLATRTQERNENAVVTGSSNTRRTKTATMPYMNTRSVTRKLYTVGATYQAPTRKDETEWREWPVHGMHERPVFHPQVGLAAGYGGRVFWTTTDNDGLNWTYREVVDVPEEVEVVPVDPRRKRPISPTETGMMKSSDESFEVCMHESLHSVLAYCAQVMAPGYGRCVVAKKRRHDVNVRSEPDRDFPLQKDSQIEAEVQPIDAASTHLNLTELEDSSISDETLMEMSSIYKKLLPIEDQPSSREDSPSLSAEGSSTSGNNFTKLKIGYLSVPKNTNEASEIARILSEYNESLKETGLSRPFSSTNPVTVQSNNENKGSKEKRDSKEPEVKQKTFVKGKTVSQSLDQDAAKSELPKLNPDTTMSSNNWLAELLVDTSLLYCVATGVDQRDLKQYVDTLDSKQSLQWLRTRDG